MSRIASLPCTEGLERGMRISAAPSMLASTSSTSTRNCGSSGGLEHYPPPLRAVGALVRKDLAAGRDRIAVLSSGNSPELLPTRRLRIFLSASGRMRPFGAARYCGRTLHAASARQIDPRSQTPAQAIVETSGARILMSPRTVRHRRERPFSICCAIDVSAQKQMLLICQPAHASMRMR